MSKIETAITWMENTAADDRHGYDQIYRWGERGDYDCSAAVITAWEKAGIKVKSAGATYTGNMYDAFLKCGFKDVTKTVNLATGSGLQRGDVLLNVQKHVAMYCGNGKEVEASINEKGTARGGKAGDQTGREFLVRLYRNYPWDHVLRYSEAGTPAPAPTPIPTVFKIAGYSLFTIRKGDKGEMVRFAQTLLIHKFGYSCGVYGADADFGSSTEKAVLQFQRNHKLVQDGIIGQNTWRELLK